MHRPKVSPSYQCISGVTQPVYSKRCLKRKSGQSVQFSPNVSMRCVFSSCVQQEADTPCLPSWLTRDEVALLKIRARELAKLHFAKNSKATQATSKLINQDAETDRIGDVTRYEIMGESLRGMESITSSSIRQKRRRILDDAMLAVFYEQEEQYEAFCYRSDDPTCVVLESCSWRWDTRKLAKAYRVNAREALVYARRVAEEDAKVAAEILAEDLKKD